MNARKLSLFRLPTPTNDAEQRHASERKKFHDELYEVVDGNHLVTALRRLGRALPRSAVEVVSGVGTAKERWILAREVQKSE